MSITGSAELQLSEALHLASKFLMSEMNNSGDTDNQLEPIENVEVGE